MVFINGCGGVKINSQTKVYTPTKNKTTITPDGNYNAISNATIEPIPLQTVTVTSNDVFYPDEGYIAFDKVVVASTKRACVAMDVKSTGGSSVDGGGVTTGQTFIFAIPMGNNLSLPSTILFHLMDYTQANQSLTVYGGIFTKSEGNNYTGLIFGGASIKEANDSFYSNRMSPLISVAGSISTTTDDVILTFVASGDYPDPSASTNYESNGIKFGNMRDNEYAIISIWN